MGPPGGGRNFISSRLMSRFNIINMTFPEESQINRIFLTMLQQHLADFDAEVKIIGKIFDKFIWRWKVFNTDSFSISAEVVTTMSVDLYNEIVQKMLPTPAKMHYLFNLRDISKIFQGLLRSHKDYQNTTTSLLRLWVHEAFRVFSDRLIDEK